MDDVEVNGPKHNRLGTRIELVIAWILIGAVLLWLAAGTPGIG